MSSIIKPTNNARAAIEPITTPAIAPPDNPFPLLEAAAAAVVEAEGVTVDVTVLVVREIDAVIVGNTTPTHLESALEL
jgi:hypothetical protein